jgi:hypothetical protein
MTRCDRRRQSLRYGKLGECSSGMLLGLSFFHKKCVVVCLGFGLLARLVLWVDCFGGWVGVGMWADFCCGGVSRMGMAAMERFAVSAR